MPENPSCSIKYRKKIKIKTRKIVVNICCFLINIPILNRFLTSIFRKITYTTNIRIAVEKKFTTLPKISIYTFGRKFLKHSSSEQEKHLFYYADDVLAGIGHLRSNLRVLLQESIYLNRLAVLTKPNLAPKHNNGIRLNSSWLKYYNIGKSLQERGGDYITYENFIKKHFARKEVLLVSATQAINPAQNKQYKLIIRDVRETILYRKSIKYFTPASITWYYQRRIIEAVEKVKTQLPAHYCAIHLRRTDRVYKSNKMATTPQNVLQKLQQYNPKKFPVFLLTDEPNRKFYKNLETEFQIFRYYDFENLVQIAKEKDNYFLYLIEILILEQATVSLVTSPTERQIIKR